jgi:hypothetical protein
MNTNPKTTCSKPTPSNEGARFDISESELKEILQGEYDELQKQAFHRRILEFLFTFAVAAMVLVIGTFLWAAHTFWR